MNTSWLVVANFVQGEKYLDITCETDPQSAAAKNY